MTETVLTCQDCGAVFVPSDHGLIPTCQCEAAREAWSASN